METYQLDIQELENKLIITIDKNQLNSDYILNLMSWLQFASTKPNEKNSYFFKFQQVTKKQLEPKPKREWKFSGSVDLKNQLDNINLRDFAYE